MDKSNTIKTIEKYYSLLGSENPTQEEKDFVWHFELELAKVLLSEFGDKYCNKLSKILSACTHLID